MNILNFFDMTKQAQNSIDLYAGNNPATIKQALKMQKKSIVSELMEHFDAKNIDELAIKLSNV